MIMIILSHGYDGLLTVVLELMLLVAAATQGNSSASTKACAILQVSSALLVVFLPASSHGVPSSCS